MECCGIVASSVGVQYVTSIQVVEPTQAIADDERASEARASEKESR